MPGEPSGKANFFEDLTGRRMLCLSLPTLSARTKRATFE